MLNKQRFILELVQAKNLSPANGKKLLLNLEQHRELKSLQHGLLVRDNQTPNTEQYSVFIDPEQALLKDHLIHGEKILPGAVHIECVISAFENLFQLGYLVNDLVVIEEIVWLVPVLVYEKPVKLNLCFEHRLPARIQFSIKNDDEIVFSQGYIYMADVQPVSKILTEHFTENSLLHILSKQECYSIFEKSGLAYGSSLQGLNKIHKNKNKALAEIIYPADVIKSLPLYTVHPALLDYGFQACIGCQTDLESEPKIPFVLSRFRYTNSKYTLTKITCVRHPEKNTTDITFFSEQNEPVITMEGLVARPLARQDYSTHLYVPTWKTFHPEQSHTTHEIDFLNTCVVFVHLNNEFISNKSVLKSLGCDVYNIAFDAKDQGSSYIDVVKQLIHILQTITHKKEHVKNILQVIVPNEFLDGPFIGLSALLKSAELDVAHLKTQLIGIEKQASQSFSQLIHELSQNTLIDTIKVNGEQLQVRQLKPYSNPVSDTKLPDGVYIITGGAGGLGKVFIQELSRCGGDKTLIIVGRKPHGNWFAQEFSSYAPIKLEYIAADITDKEKTFAFIESVKQKYGKISVVIHASGIFNDDLITNKNAEDINQVLAPKVLGIDYLDEATASEHLDLFIAFSSIAGYFGNLGQSDYAAANGYLDGFMANRALKVKQGLRYGKSLSIAWPLWEEGGMHIDEASLAMLKRRGLSRLDTPTGLKQFYSACASDMHHVVSLVGDVQRMQQHQRTSNIQTNIEQNIKQKNSAETISIQKHAVQFFKGMLSDIIRLSADRIEANVLFEKYGIDSIKIMKMTNELENIFGVLPKILFFEKQNINELVDFFVQKYPDKLATLFSISDTEKNIDYQETATDVQNNIDVSANVDDTLNHMQPAEKATPNQHTDIAIVGVAGRYPGAADLNEFWSNLLAGKDCIQTIPQDRWNNALFYEKNRHKTGKIHSQWGGFIDGVYEFDPLFFNVSPKEAKFLDPQERLFLQCAYHTLEDAGYTAETLGSKVGVFVGVMYEEYQLFGEVTSENSFSLPGNPSSIPNRVSHYFNFQGPSLAIDTMCSSSLSALHLAIESLKRAECDSAIVGGVNVTLHPNKYFLLSQGQFISSRGHCESFGEGGDGYIPGEGVGAVLIRPLSLANTCGDNIYAVIKGSAINHGGKANGFTVPNPRAQSELITKVLHDSRIHPDTISYIEAHGTGTSLGDPIEIAGLTQAFSSNKKQFCAIGSVKSNIGHCESAAGIAALTKVLLQLQHKTLVPSLHSTILNPNIDFKSTPFYVQQQVAPWSLSSANASTEHQFATRLAGISSFGAGGSNAHIIIEENPELPWPILSETECIIVLSAKSKAQLHNLAKSYVDLMRSEHGKLIINHNTLPHIAFTLQQGRDQYDERLALVVKNANDLQIGLETFLAQQKSSCVFYNAIEHNKTALIEQDAIDISVAHWIAQKAFNKIAEAWCNGWTITWENITKNIFQHITPRRMSLPKMPFARDVYRIAKTANRFTGDTYQFSTSNKLHPLIHQNVSMVNQQRFTTRFTGTEFVVSDHVIQKNQVLPGVAYLEMAYQALKHSFPSDYLQNNCIILKQVVWLKPYIVNASSAEIFTHIILDEQKQLHFSITNEDSGNQTGIFCQGKIAIEKNPEKTSIDIHVLKRELVAQNKNIADIYNKFREAGVEYGPAYQCISEIYTDKTRVLAKLELAPQFATQASDFCLNPGILDAATQVSVYFDRDKHQSTSMAYFVENVIVHDVCQPCMWAYLTEHKDSNDKTKKINIEILNEVGNVCVSFRALSFRKILVEESTQQPILQSIVIPAADPLCLIPLWKPIHAWFKRDDYLLGDNSQCLFVIFDNNNTALQNQVLAGKSVICLSEYQTPEQIADILKTVDVDTFDKIIVQISLGDSLDSQIEQYFYHEKGIAFTLLNLIKALIAYNHNMHPLNWLVITRQEQKVLAHEQRKSSSGLIQGLLGTAIKEHPTWSASYLDIGKEKLLEPWEFFITNPDVKELYIAERDGIWFEKRYFPVQLKNETTSFRQKGLYIVIGGAGAVGNALTHYLKKNYDAQVIWLGRRPFDTNIQGKIEQQFSEGTQPVYYQCDASVYTEFERVINALLNRYGEIHGVVHAAVDLHSRNIKSLHANDFIAALASKVDVSINIARVFKMINIDFVLFLSSITIFIRTQGQASYASACNFIEEFAETIQDQYRIPAKIINLGYWGGEVFENAKETAGLRLWLDRIGMSTLDPKQALIQIDALLSNNFNNVSLLKVKRNDVFENSPVEISKDIQLATEIPVNIARLETVDNQPTFLNATIEGEKTSADELNNTLIELLTAIIQEPELQSHLFSRFSWQYKWLNSSRELISDKTANMHQGGYSDALENWNNHKTIWLNNPYLKSQVILIDKILPNLLNILSGKMNATEILFRQNNEKVLEDVYKTTPLLAYQNNILASQVRQFIDAYQATNKFQALRIIEIGAGTGATTGVVLDTLKPFASNIDVYHYTDISKFFLQLGKKSYLTENSFMDFALLDIEKSIAQQHFALGSYDILIASNVLHATSRIDNTLDHVKQLLKKNGLLLLNEINTHSVMSHLTFGLTEGWWHFNDDHVRIPGGPGLSFVRWNNILEGSGFYNVKRLTRAGYEFGQQVIAAQSDGVFAIDKAAPNSITTDDVPAHTTETFDTNQQPIQQDSVNIKAVLLNSLSDALDIKVEMINVKTAFSDYGLDSIVGVGLTENLNSKLGINLNPTDLFDYSNVEELVAYIEKQFAHELAALFAEDSTVNSSVSALQETVPLIASKHVFAAETDIDSTQLPVLNRSSTIAVIGMSGQFPGAMNIDEFWDNIINEKNIIQDIRTHKHRNFLLDHEATNTGSLYAGILENRDCFDPIFFNLSPKEAEEMNPHQRLVMQEGWNAIENAGYDPLSFANESVGIFVGAEPSGYQSSSFTGGSEAIIASRLSYFLNTRGPALVVNTGCSSSAVAIHLACESLRKHESKLALAGGVFANITAPGLTKLVNIGMLSRSGECRPFDANADGTVLSEAVSFVLLKPLADAKRDNDFIYGVIHGSAMNQDGFSNGITAPNGRAQEDLIVQLYKNSAVDIAQLDYIEAHGTGTVLGDPVEVNALTRALAQLLPKSHKVYLGSVKSHIGHTSAAAGVSALIKIMLCLKHETLPGLKNFNTINPNINQHNSNLIIQNTTQEWKKKDEAYRLAGFSSFGHSGTNVHMLVGEEIQ